MATRKSDGSSFLIYRGWPLGTLAIRLVAGSPAQASALALVRALASGLGGAGHRSCKGPIGPNVIGNQSKVLGASDTAKGSIPQLGDQSAAGARIVDSDNSTTVATVGGDAEGRGALTLPTTSDRETTGGRRVQPRRPARDLASLGPEDLMTPDEMCRYLNIADSTGRNWRLRAYGPEHVRVSPRCLRFRKGTVDAWLEARSFRSTSETIKDA